MANVDVDWAGAADAQEKVSIQSSLEKVENSLEFSIFLGTRVVFSFGHLPALKIHLLRILFCV